MQALRLIHVFLFACVLGACGGGGGTKSTPTPSTTCSDRLGTGSFVTGTVTNPSVTDSVCPAGSTLTQSGISYTTTTTSYSCPNPNSTSNPVATSTTSAPIVTQSKICTPAPAGTCAQKLGTGAFVDGTRTETVADSTCPAGQVSVQDGLSDITTTTTYSCADPNGTDDPVAAVIVGAPVLKRPKMCNLAAPIDYSTYFRDKTGVTQANAAGFTGQGVKVVVYDNGFNIANAALDGRVSKTFGDLTDDDPDNASHGTSTSAILAGRAIGDYPGGVAPDAILAVSDWDADIQQIINWGAKVYNFSFGYDAETDGASSADVSKYLAPWISELRAVRNSGAFIAISAGNDEKSSAQILAGAPAFYSDLDNILAVVAMSPLYGTLAPYSNQCGEEAKTFCIAAPGTVNLLKPEITAGDTLTADSYAWFAGTSAAAPVVSGIAALVYQAFPGFTGRQVRDTLISTATDIGELGVDAVYGVGYVNAQKAVLGPGALSDNFQAAVPDQVLWNFGNDIGGTGGIVKTGNGTLSLTGSNTYSGGTDLQSGQLALIGSVTGQLQVNGGTLLALGSVNGDVLANAGTLALSLEKPFDVQGELQLAGSLLSVLSPSGYLSQWQGVLAEASHITGSARMASESPWFSAEADIHDQQITAHLQRTAVTDVLPNGTVTEMNAAANLEAAFRQLDTGAGTAALRQSAGLLQATTREQAETAFNSLSGQSQTTAKDIALDASDALQPLLTERLFDLARAPGERGGAWLMFANPDGKKHAEGFLSVDIDSTLIAAGVDRQGPYGTIGVALFAADDSARFEGVSDVIDGDRQGAALYVRHDGSFGYLQGFAYLSHFAQRNTRTLMFGAAGSVAGSRSDGSSRGVSIQAGKALNAKLSGALQLSADWVDVDAFSETGATGLELQFQDSSLSRYLLGPDIRYHDEAGNGLSWDALIGYRFVLNGVDTDMTAAYAGLPGQTFTVLGMPYSDGFLNWSAGLGYQLRGAYWYLRGDGQQADNAERMTLSAGVRIGF
ncbi:MAG TPA: S8 family serine peptidase [Arenimonas sp.]|nr:S8 family serine peptidase [Arenimonas sp.]